MKKAKKAISLGVVLVIMAMMVLPANGILGKHTFQEEEKILPDQLVTPISLRNIPMPKATEGKEISLTVKHIPLLADIPVATTPEDESHPTLAMDGSGWLFGAYALQPSIIESNIIYTFSGDGGTTWEDMGSYALEGVYDYPAIDYWGSGNTFVGTFRPDPGDCDGAAQYVLRVDDPTDLETWSLVYWDWTSFGQRDRESPDIAGYSDVGDATWWYGVMADTEGSDDPDASGEHVPVFNFPSYTDESSGWGWWWDSFENSAHACIDMDRSNGMMYAAWDWYNESAPEKGRDILLCIADMHDWWEENWVINWYTLGGSEANTYPDIAAENGYIYVVCQGNEIGINEDIICFYSSDGGENWDVSNIAANPNKDEMYPSIVAYGEGASCTFTVDGDLYVSHTDDGGVTWSAPEKVNDETGSVSMEYRTAKVTTSGHTFWTDTRNGNADIYYDIAGAAGPILSIESISGGFGVKATVTNIGTMDATDVGWTIDLEGLVIIGKHKEGTIPTLAAGGEETIKSGFVLGLGTVDITVTADGAEETATGFMLGPLVLGVK